jgi:hypothetical protein
MRVGRHTTRLPETERLYQALFPDPLFKKFIFGIFLPLGAGLPRVKIQDQQGCLFLKVFGPDGAQEFRVYTNDLVEARKRVAKAVKGLGWPIK